MFTRQCLAKKASVGSALDSGDLEPFRHFFFSRINLYLLRFKIVFSPPHSSRKQPNEEYFLLISSPQIEPVKCHLYFAQFLPRVFFDMLFILFIWCCFMVHAFFMWLSWSTNHARRNAFMRLNWLFSNLYLCILFNIDTRRSTCFSLMRSAIVQTTERIITVSLWHQCILLWQYWQKSPSFSTRVLHPSTAQRMIGFCSIGAGGSGAGCCFCCSCSSFFFFVVLPHGFIHNLVCFFILKLFYAR